MEYALTPLFSSREEPISLTLEEYEHLARAKHALVTTLGIEQKFDLLLENYVEYESELLHLGLRHVAFCDSKWEAFQHENLVVARRLVNLLSAARLYLDQVDHDLGRLFDDPGEVRALVKQNTSAQYDARLGYRLMDTLRNAIQHRSIAGIFLKHHYGVAHEAVQPSDDPRTAASKRRIVVRAIPILRVADLHDMGLKAAVRAEVEQLGHQELDLTLYVREYVDGLAEVHYELRRHTDVARKEWEAAVRHALTSAKEKWPTTESNALNLVKVDSSGDLIEWTHIFPALVDYLIALETKNRGPLRLSRTYVSGHCGD